MSAAISLTERTAIAFEVVKSPSNGKCVLLTLEGLVHGQTVNCTLIPLHKVPEVVALMQSIAKMEAS